MYASLRYEYWKKSWNLWSSRSDVYLFEENYMDILLL